MTNFFDNYGPAFLGLQLLRLYSEIDKGGNMTVAENMLDLPSRVASALVYLKHRGPASVSDLAIALGASHQLASQRVDLLDQHDMVTRVADVSDRRRQLLELTPSGLKAADSVDALCQVGNDAYQQLFAEIGVDLNSTVIKARKALEDRPLDLRIREIAPAQQRGPGLRSG